MNPTLLRTAAVLAGITLAVFSPTLSAGFVYDARLQILTDPFLHDPANWFDVLTFRVLARDVLDFNRPVHLASLMLDAALWGTDPFGYHLTSILLHAANVVLLWLVIGDVLGRGQEPAGAAGMAAFLGAAFFAVHPLVTEAVCEPTFREDLLAATFTLAAVALAARHARTVGNDVRRAAGCIACCLLAIGSKESGLAAPLVLGAYWLIFRRGEPGWFWPAVVGGGKVVVLAFLAARFLLEPDPSRIFEQKPEYPGGSLAAALAIEPRILALYTQLTLLPVNLCADYGLFSVRHLPLWASLAVLAVVVGLAVVGVRRDGRILFGIALVLAPLLPVSNLIPIYRAAADRYLYLPLAGVACIIGCLFDAALVRADERRRQAILVGGMLAIVALAMGCVARQTVWSSQLTLWENTFLRNPQSFTAASGYAGALVDAGRGIEGEALARRALAICDGQRGDAWLTLALALDAQGRTAAADEAVAKAIEVDSRLADPDARVAALAMERTEAEKVKKLLARRRDGTPD